jgi:hypothetical protein
MVKERLSCNGLPQAIKHGCPTMDLQANVRAMGIHVIITKKEQNYMCLLPAK